ncbi:MAG: ABC transporter permease [Actinobacteria bacterium]|nr:ABC transporter permease [Actinomycetota bacterium]MCL6088277.1 ABC transporter permease [Actinomycetota bacterium]
MNQISGRFSLAKGKISRVQELGVGLALLALCLILGFSTENFFRITNLISILRSASYVGIMSLGMVFVLSMRDVDLSIGSIYNLAGMTVGFLLTMKVDVWLAVIIGILVGVVCGLFNIGFSIAFKIPTIIVTLGTLSVFKGLGLVISQGSPFYSFEKTSFFFTKIGGTIGKFPVIALIFLILTVIFFVIYGFTVFGIRVRGIGSNPHAAEFSGVNIIKYRIIVFILMGALAAFAGTLELSFLQSSHLEMGVGNELSVIAAVIIGGTSLAGGSGSILGALIGALIIAVIRNGIVQLGVSPYWSSTVTGFVILAAVAIDYLFKRLRSSQ